MIQFALILALLFSLPSFAGAQDITNGLVGYWKFDEGSGTTAADSSGNNNTGTLINGPTWTLAPSNGGDGKIGGALSFDGITQYVNSGSNTVLDNLPALSFSAWINPSTATYGPQGTVVQKGHGGISLLYEGWILAFLANNPTQLGFQSKHQTTDLLVVAQPNTFTMNEWQHVVVTWDGTTNASGVKIFKNGGEVSYATQQNGSGTRVSDDTRNFLLGSNSYNSTPFGGSLDEVRIYDRALSSSDIQALYAYTGGSPHCNDTIDNDSDGRIDYPSDPGCTSSSDTDETDPPPPDTQAPTVPTNLTATPQSLSQINLSWTASTDPAVAGQANGVTGYRVERCAGSSCTNFIQISTPSGTTFNDTGLTANTTYRYQVRATDAANNLSGYSSIVSATTQSIPTGGTVLGNLAASMASGTWRIVPMQNINLTAQAFYPNTGAPGPGYDGTQPGWNSKKLKLYIETVEHGAASDCSNFPNMPHICFKPLWTYDDATDTWTINGPTPGAATGGVQGYHHYYEVAWDDDNEVLYIRQFYSGNFYRYCVNNTPSWCSGKQGTWTPLPAMNLWASCCQQLMYHPTLGGGTLLYFDGAAGSTSGQGCGALIGFKESTNTWSIIHNGAGCYFPDDPYSDIGGYSSAKQLAVFGGGAPKHMWKIDQNGTIAQLDDSPFAIGSSNGKFASLAADPVSGNFILIGGTAAGQMWELNPTASSGSQWTLLDDSLNATGEICNVKRNGAELCSFDFYATPISTYGVIGYWKWVNTTKAEYWLYKHVAGTPPPSDTQSPTVPTNLTATAQSSSQINLSWTASTDNVGVTGYRVERCQGSTCTNFAQIATPTTNSYSDTGLTANTTYRYQVRATDAAGNFSSYSSIASATTQTAPVDTTPPTVSITTPANGSTVSGSSVTVSANASDNVSVSGVQFLLGGANLGTEDTTSPYSITWDTTSTTNSSHTLTARVRDTTGNQTTSSSITITVNNTVPPPGGSDFQTRCSQLGVIRCIGFDQAADIANTLWGGNTGISTSGASIPALDSSMKASGNSSVKFTIPSNSPANSSGEYWANFSTDLATQFGENSDFYIQWRQRFSPEFITTAYVGGGGWKQAIITTGDKLGCTTSNSTNCYASCTAIGVITQNTYHREFAQMYNSCTGSTSHGPYDGFEELFGSFDFKLQNARPSPYCLYSQSGANRFPPNGNCFGYFPNEWMTFQVRIKIGPRGAAGVAGASPNDEFVNSYVELWIAREGKPAEQAFNWGPYNLSAGSPSENQRYGKIWLTPYNTGRDSSVTYPTAYTWYDELIISRNKIADPGTTPPPTPLLGDLNGDRTVNNFDWNIMAGVWFTNDPVADINKDGIVNTADFYFIYTNWNITN